MAHIDTDHSTQSDSTQQSDDFYIVGIGASAGGLEALERMFKHMPEDTGMAFVVIQHVSPDFKSLMDELLARHTGMPIYRVEDGMHVEPNSIYLLPPYLISPKMEMIVSEGQLRLTDKDPTETTPPIDHLFNSMAQDAGRRSIAIVLSGTGSDGSRGICDIHEAGGLVIAQSEETAKFDGMPRSAALTGVVDVTAAPEKIPGLLSRYAQSPLRSQWEEEEKCPVDESSLDPISCPIIRRRDEFLAMISHELRNPAGAVLNAIEAIRRVNTQFDEEHKVIHRQITHMARLLDDLLDVARLQQNRIEFRKQTIDLVALSNEVLEAVQHQFEAKDQLLHVTVCDGTLPVFGDPARLKQVQVNLLTNAAKYTPDRGDVWYEIEHCREEAVITVRDSGHGIPAELRESVFNLFVQAAATLDRSSGGMGVGLWLAHNIIEAHDGSIVAESAGLGKGSTFRVRLQLSDKPLPPKVPTPHFSFQGRKLLLVEDNDDARQMLAKTLRLSGFEVADARDGQTALEMFRTFQPEVAVIDIGLPGMDGYQLAREVRQIAEAAETMLVALTGYGREEDRQAAIEAGFDAHLVKPLNPSELYRQISTNFATHEAT